METKGSSGNDPTVEDAAAALRVIEDSRARASRADYPMWFWVGSGAGLAGLPASTLVPGWWDLLASAVAVVLIMTMAVWLSRTRRVRDRPTSPSRRQLLWLVPILAVLLAGAVLPRFGLWWAPLVVAGLVFVVFVSVGLLTSRRPMRR